MDLDSDSEFKLVPYKNLVPLINENNENWYNKTGVRIVLSNRQSLDWTNGIGFWDTP